MIKKEQMDSLFKEAEKAAEAAYAPYSNFRVGAALLCEDGTVVTGVNVENRSFGLTICGERNAITTGITMGKRTFLALAVSTPDSVEPTSPCGACRQVISEFMQSDAPVRFKGSGTNQVDTTIGELIPWGESLNELRKE
ncbi:MAG: cytidine deaminase [Treponema sp.]|jgi:cytidine deaminase|nr:cytidine deaminase [Treponema sp.]